MVTTQWKLYTSQWIPHNKNSTLQDGYKTMKTVHFTMLKHNGKSILYRGPHTMETIHFTMVTHNGKSTL